MAIRIVQSKLNARIKELRGALRQPSRVSNRVTGEMAGLEGIHLLAEALRSGVELQTVFIAQGHEQLLYEAPLAQFHLADTYDVVAVPRDVLDFAVTTESPQPVAALAKPRNWSWDGLFLPARSAQRPPLLIVLSGIQDPGNLGTILRSAEAFGASGAVSLPGTVSHWNPKAMRASAGSVFRLPILGASDVELFDRMNRAGIRTVAAMAHDAQPLNEVDLTVPAAILIGSEGSGLAPELAAQCDARITIPCPGPVESLNAAVAASVLLYEASRQRAGNGKLQANPQRLPGN